MIKFGIHIDTTNFDKKPVGGEIGGIRNRIDNNHCKDSYTPMCDILTLSKAIQNGYTFMPCHVAKMPEDAPEKYRFYSQQVIFIDIDNSDGRGKDSKPLPETEYFTLDKIQATLRNHGITPTIIYHSFSSKPDFEKFRVVIVLDEPITDRAERDKAVNALYQLFGNSADSSCRSIEKLFFGSYPNSVIVCDETAITTKGTLLQLHDELFKPELDVQATLDDNQSEDITAEKPLNYTFIPPTAPTSEGGAMEWDGEIQALTSQKGNSSMHSGGIDKTKSPDFDPNVLLSMIDPCKLSYSEWITVSASYKTYEAGGQSLDFWLQWCSPYPNDDRKADTNTWNGLTGEDITKGSLLKFAKLHSPDKYFDYVQAMNPHSRKFADTSLRIGNSSMQAPVGGADSSQSDTMPEISYDDLKGSLFYRAENGEILLKSQKMVNGKINGIPMKFLTVERYSKTLENGKTIKFSAYMPYFIFDADADRPDKPPKLTVSPRLLENFIQKYEYYFFVKDHAFDGVRCFWYDKSKGVYSLVSETDIKSLLKSYITPWESPTLCKKVLVTPSLVKAKLINEIYTLLTWDSVRNKPESVLDADEMTINFRNGLYNLKTGQFTEHSPLNYSTIQLDVDYIPFNTTPDIENQLAEKCPVFMNYLNTLTDSNPEKMQFLLEYMGACLSNVHGYRYKKALFLIGEGNTGKSQYIRLICELLGNANHSAVSFPELDDRFQSGATYGKRLVVDADMKIMRAKSNHNFMMYTGGDPRQVEFKGLNPFTAVYNGFLLFAANELPKFGGNTTDAAYNRMIILYCNNVIPENQQDPELLQKMLAERQGIVSLALYYFMQTIQKKYKFTIPAECGKNLIDMKKGNSPAVDFYSSCCEWLPDSDTNINSCFQRSEMYRIFTDWCKANQNHGYTPSAKEFKKEIMQFLHITDEIRIQRKYNGTWYYKFKPTKETLNEFRNGCFTVVE